MPKVLWLPPFFWRVAILGSVLRATISGRLLMLPAVLIAACNIGGDACQKLSGILGLMFTRDVVSI